MLYSLIRVISPNRGRNSKIFIAEDACGIMAEIKEILEKIGLTENEAKVYVALLDLGESSIGGIIKEAGVASSKVYELLNKLMEKGLISTHIEANIKYFKAVDPRRIKDYVGLKINELKDDEKSLNEVLPSLISKFESKKKEIEVELFQGYKGIKTVFYNMIRELGKGNEFLVIGGGDSPSANENTKLFFEQIHKKRAEKGIIQRIIFSEARRKSYSLMRTFKHTIARFLPYGSPSTLNIYDDTTILLVMSPSPAAIRIKDKQITDSYKQYFERMWKIAKK